MVCGASLVVLLVIHVVIHVLYFTMEC